ncbi:uncharacterized protein LOC123526955 [Mercenaria mercenaria]|uniref:uncharacterized protein LOC123526955 n=1 Tax=Mercenaria mercenaria TaxID=6596 RepID=UPI00234EF9AE|nr:uncharacterized protein LOC123526955 [Mercenaria mercenaria]
MANAGFAFWRRGCKEEIFADNLNIKRVPAAVLFNRDKTLHSFGYEAVSNHSRHALNKKHSQYLYFRYFSLSLYEKNRCSTLCKTDCDDIPGGVHILSQVFDILRERVIKSVLDILPDTHDNIEDNIELILTTPASVTDQGKALIMEAVKNSKFDEKRFCQFSESDATAWLCKCQQLQITKSNKFVHMSMSSKYMIGDLGAGKSVISVYEIRSKTRLIRLAVRIKKIGGNSVNDEFEGFMKSFCESGEWENFKADKHGEYGQLIKQFEEEKIKFDNETECVILSLPNSLLGIIKDNKSKTSGGDETDVVDDKLVIHKQLMKKFFKPSIKKIVKKIVF